MTKQHHSTKSAGIAAGAAAARAAIAVAESIPQPSAPDREQIALLAFRYWQERGCPEGSPEEDWLRAETDLQTQAGKAAPESE